jgi:hypothetical protein
MIRVLVLIAVTGFLAGVVALAGAAALGGPELAARNWNWVIDGHRHHRSDRDDDRPWREETPRDDDAEQSTRELAWDGSAKVEFDIPATIEFTQAPGPGKLTITGPKDVIQRVQLAGGRLTLDQPPANYVRLRVVMTAPAVTRFEIGGDDRLDIRDYKQDQLSIVATGSSEVVASGAARLLDLDLSGSGEADLTALAAEAAEADVSGAAQATIAARDSASLEISGSGSVKLVTRPRHLETDVTGAGSVIFEDGGRATGTGTPARTERPDRET